MASSNAAKDKIAKAPPSKVEVKVAPVPDNPISVIVSAILGVIEAVPNVEKNGVNDFHKYNYVTEADLLARVRVEMIKQGLVLIPSCTEFRPIDQWGNTHLLMSYTLAHVSGAVWPEKIVVPGSGNDKSTKSNSVGDKGTYKAMTGANKYAMLKVLQIAMGSDDPETDDLAHKQQPAQGGGQRVQGSQQRGGGQGGGQRQQFMTVKEEDEFKGYMLTSIKQADDPDTIEKLMGKRENLDKLDRVSKRTKEAIRGEAAECFRRLGGGSRRNRQIPVDREDDHNDDRRGGRREGEGQQREDDPWPTEGDEERGHSTDDGEEGDVGE